MDFLSRSQASELVQKYKLIGFGAGILGARTVKFLDGKISYFIDNLKDKHGKSWEGEVPIRPVEALEDEDIEKVIIVLCSEQYNNMAKQLYDLYPSIKIYKGPLLKDYETFDRLMNSCEKLLVSAYGAGGGLYIVDTKADKYTLLQEGSFRGIIKYKDRLIITKERGEILEVSSIEPFEYKVGHIPDTYSNVHGLEYYEKENVLFMTETINDHIAILNADSLKKIGELPISEKSKVKGKDCHHINDLYLHGDSLLVSVISRSGWWKSDIFDGSVLEFDLKSKHKYPTPILTDLVYPHSLQFYNNKFYLIEALKGEVIDGSRDLVIKLPGVLRGLACDGTLFYVGQSLIRRKADVERYFDGISMDCGIYIVDPESKVYRFVKLPHMADVYNIHILKD